MSDYILTWQQLKELFQKDSERKREGKRPLLTREELLRTIETVEASEKLQKVLNQFQNKHQND